MILSLTLPLRQTIVFSPTIHDTRFDTLIFLTSIPNSYQNVTYEGDLIVENNQTFTIQDSEFNMIGKIIVKDTSTLIIRNSKFIAIPPWDGDSIVMLDNSNLIITNTTVIFKHPGGFDVHISLQHNAKANITYSTFKNHGYILAYNNATIYVSNSTITLGTKSTKYSGVSTFDFSTAEIENSTVDGVFIWDNSTVSLKNSIVKLLRTTWEQDRTTVNLMNSEIYRIETYGGTVILRVDDSEVTSVNFLGNCSALFMDSSVEKMSARGNTRVLLLKTSYGDIETYDNATVLVGWHIPLFGLITIPYTWVPIFQGLLFLIITAVIIVTLVIIIKEWKKGMPQVEKKPTMR